MMGMGNMPNMDEMKKNARQRPPSGKPPRERQDVGKILDEQLPPDVNTMMKGLFGK